MLIEAKLRINRWNSVIAKFTSIINRLEDGGEKGMLRIDRLKPWM